MPSSDDRRCFCGEAYLGHEACVKGQNCPRQKLGAGHWHVALPQLQVMNSASRDERYPRLDLPALEHHVARMTEKYTKRRPRTKSSAAPLVVTHAAPDADQEVSLVEPTGRFWRRGQKQGASSGASRAWGPAADDQQLRSRSSRTIQSWRLIITIHQV